MHINFYMANQNSNQSTKIKPESKNWISIFVTWRMTWWSESGPEREKAAWSFSLRPSQRQHPGFEYRTSFLLFGPELQDKGRVPHRRRPRLAATNAQFADIAAAAAILRLLRFPSFSLYSTPISFVFYWNFRPTASLQITRAHTLTIGNYFFLFFNRLVTIYYFKILVSRIILFIFS